MCPETHGLYTVNILIHFLFNLIVTAAKKRKKQCNKTVFNLFITHAHDILNQLTDFHMTEKLV